MFTPLQRFFKLLKPNREAIRNLYIFAIISGVISLSLPLGIQSIINLIQGGEVSASWVLLVGVVLLGYLFIAGLQVIQLRITEDLQKDIFVRSAFEFAFRIPRITMSSLHGKYAPELMNRFFDTMLLQKGAAKILLEFTAAGLQIFFGLILLSLYHPFFIVFSLMVIVTVFITGRYIFSKGLVSSFSESKYKYQVAFWLEEIARTHTTFRLAYDAALPLKKTDEFVHDYLTAREKHFKVILGHYYLFILFKILVAAGFLIMGGMLVFNQQMNIGQFVAAEIIVLLLLSSSERLLLTLEQVYDLLTSIEKIGQVTDLPLENNEGKEIALSSVEKGIAISIKDVWFTYPEEPYPVLKGCSLEIPANESICITGSSGSGKTTLTQLLTAFYTPQLGTIHYNGIPVSNYNLTQLRTLIADCTPEDSLFEGTLLDNLTFGSPIPLDQITSLMEVLQLRDFLHSLPEGFQTNIGPQSRKLAGNTVQKLLLARNLLKQPRILIVEDIFTQLEKEEKVQIYKYILDEAHYRTNILLSKDPDIMALVNRTIIMKEGQVSTILTNKNLEIC
jgi:ABC-type bacteriocin/lantibiotic exporter with double-glycine peptidase domain